MKLMRVLLKWNLPWKEEKKSRKNDKHKVAKWDKIEIRLGVKGNSVCEPLKRRESNLPKRLVLVSSSGHYSKVSASCLPSIRKQQQQQSWKKWERERKGKGSWKQKLNEFFGGSIICPRLTTRHEILITASLTDKTLVRSVPRFIHASCQIPVASCAPSPPFPLPPNRTWIAKVLQQFIYLHREPFLKPAKPGNLSTKLSSIFNWLAIPKRPSSKSNTHLNPILIGPTPKPSPASLEVGQNLLQSARFLKFLSFCILCSLLFALP